MKDCLEPAKIILSTFLAEIENVQAIRKNISPSDSYWEKENAYTWLCASVRDFRFFMYKLKPIPELEYYSQPA